MCPSPDRRGSASRFASSFLPHTFVDKASEFAFHEIVLGVSIVQGPLKVIEVTFSMTKSTSPPLSPPDWPSDHRQRLQHCQCPFHGPWITWAHFTYHCLSTSSVQSSRLWSSNGGSLVLFPDFCPVADGLLTTGHVTWIEGRSDVSLGEGRCKTAYQFLVQ